MEDQYKTKKQLIEETEVLRKQVFKLKKVETDRKQAEAELKKERDRAQRYLDIAGVMLVAINPNQEVVLINRKGCEILGYEEGEIIGKNWFDHFVPERDRKSTRTAFAKLLAAEIEPVEYFENSVLTKSGTEKIIAWHNTIITDENGHVMGTLSSGEDVTERKKAEEALRESEKRYRLLAENVTDVIWTMDMNLRLTYVTPSVARLRGYSVEEAMSQTVDKMMTTSSLGVATEVLAQELSKEDLDHEDPLRSRTVELEENCKDGSTVWTESTITFLRQSDGRPVGILGITRDITERRRAEEALQESEKRYRTLAETAPDMIFIVDRRGCVKYVNSFAAKQFSKRPEEIIGKNIQDLFPSDTSDRQRHHLQKVFETGKPVYLENRTTFLNRDVWLSTWLTPLLNEAGEVYSVLGISRDITERKQAEEALRENEKKFRELFDEAPVGYFEYDAQGRIVSVNRTELEMLGYTLNEMIGQPAWKFIVEGDPGRDLVLAKLAGTVPPSRNLERTYRRKDGTTFPALVQDRLLQDAEGKILGVRATIQDITDHKRAEEALRDREERFRTLADTTSTAIFIYQGEQFAYINKATETISGYSNDEFLTMRFWDLIHPEFRDLVRSRGMARQRGESMPDRYEVKIRCKDGSERWIDYTAGTIHWEGKPAIIGTAFDITDRKRAEESLKQSEENARHLAHENAIMAEIGRIIGSTLDIDQVYEGFSAEVEKIIPFDRIVINIIDVEKGAIKNVYIAGKEVQDRNVEDVYPLEGSGSAEMVRTKSTLLIQTEDFSQYEDRFPMLLSTFQAGFRSIMNVPLFSKGRIIGGLLFRSRKPYAYTDKNVRLAERIASQIAGAVENAQLYAERIQAEQDRAALHEQLRQSQKMEAIGRLAGGVAHDFNNLLTVIKGYSQLSLAETKEGNPLRENIEEIRKASTRAADLTRQLLAFSRRQVMEMKVLDLNDLLTNLDKMLRRVIGEDIELVTLLEKDLGRVKADPGQIEQMIMNLVVNSRDAMSGGGNLTIETTNVTLDGAYARAHVAVTPGPYVMISVSDTGTGMTPDIKERVFEPFYTTKEKGRGTGLGLSTVYGIVKQSAGNIWVYSEPGKGTTFKIYLPRVDEPPAELKEKVVGKEPPRGNETILIVEDEEEVLKLAGRILAGLGYTVLEKLSGEEAVKMCKEQKKPFHLLLTDVVMPQMNGRQLANHLREVCQDFRILYMSGYTDNAIVQHGVLEEGMNYIQKPFTLDDLARKVREVLDK